jgi:hypothetical protein
MCKKDSQGEESSRDWNVAIRGGNKANKQAGRVGLMTMQDNATVLLPPTSGVGSFPSLPIPLLLVGAVDLRLTLAPPPAPDPVPIDDAAP